MRNLAPNMTDYLQTRASFRLEVPERYNYARDVVDAWAVREPGKLALLAVGPDGGDPGRFSFPDLARSSDRAARFLAAQGVRKGDRVFVMLPRVPDWYDVILGCIKLGAIPMPGTTLLTPRDIAYRVTQADAGVAVVDAEGTSKVDQVATDCPSLRTRICLADDGRPAGGWLSWHDGLAEAGDGPPGAEPTRADDPMLLYFTSGTVAQRHCWFSSHSYHTVDLRKCFPAYR
jgi:acyl-coenzyme A synthetase/AMP-(fatty) acid ligase